MNGEEMKQGISLLLVVFAFAVTTSAQSATAATSSDGKKAPLSLSDLLAEQAQYDKVLVPHNAWAADFRIRLESHNQQIARQKEVVDQQATLSAAYKAALESHNTNRCSAPANDPGQCSAYNQEADRLNAERALLEKQIAQINAEADRLDAQKAALDIEQKKINAEKVQIDLEGDRLNADIAEYRPHLSKDVAPKITDQGVINAALDKGAGEWNLGVCAASKWFNVLHLVVEGRAVKTVANGVPNTDSFHDMTNDPFVWTFAEAENRDGTTARTYSYFSTLSKDGDNGAKGDSLVSFMEIDPINAGHSMGLYVRSNDTKKQVLQTETAFAVRSVGFTEMETFAKEGKAICNDIAVLSAKEQTAYLKKWAAR
jgi:hypothetical protein